MWWIDSKSRVTPKVDGSEGVWLFSEALEDRPTGKEFEELSLIFEAIRSTAEEDSPKTDTSATVCDPSSAVKSPGSGSTATSDCESNAEDSATASQVADLPERSQKLASICLESWVSTCDTSHVQETAELLQFYSPETHLPAQCVCVWEHPEEAYLAQNRRIVLAGSAFEVAACGPESRVLVTHDGATGDCFESNGYSLARANAACDSDMRVERLQDELQQQAKAFDTQRLALIRRIDQQTEELAWARSQLVLQMSQRASAEGKISRLEVRRQKDQQQVWLQLKAAEKRCLLLQMNRDDAAREMAAKTAELNNQGSQNEFLITTARSQHAAIRRKLESEIVEQRGKINAAHLASEKNGRQLARARRELRKNRQHYEQLLRKANEERQKQAKRDQRETKRLLALVADLQTQLSEARNKHREEELQVRQKNAQLNELSLVLDKARSDIKSSQSSLHASQAEIARLQEELARQARREQDFQGELAKEFDTNVQLKSTVKKLRRHIHQREQQLTIYEESCAETSHANHRLRAQLADTSARRDAAEAVFSCLMLAYWNAENRANERLFFAKRKVESLSKRYQQLESEFASNQQSLAEAKRENETQSRLLRNAEALEQAVRELREQLATERTSAVGSQQELRSQNLELQSRVASLELQLRQSTADNDRLHSEIVRLESKIEEQRLQTDRLNKHNELLRLEARNLKEKRSQLGARNQQLESLNAQVTQRNQELESQAVKAAEESRLLLELYAEEQTRQKTLHAKLAQLEQKNKKLETAADDQRRSSGEQDREWQKRLTDLSSQLAKRDKTIDQLESKQRQLEAQLSAAELAEEQNLRQADSKLEVARQHNQQLHEASDQLLREREDLRQQLAELRQQWLKERQERMARDAKSRQCLRRWMNANAQLEKRLEATTIHHSCLEQQVDKWQAELQQASQAYRQKQISVEELQESLRSEREAHARVDCQLVDLKGQLRNNQLMLSEREANILTLSSQLEVRDRELDQARRDAGQQQADFEQQSRSQSEKMGLLKRNLDILREEVERRCRQRWELLSEAEQLNAELDSTKRMHREALNRLESDVAVRSRLEHQLDRTLRLLQSEAAGRRKAEIALNRAAEQVSETCLAQITRQQISSETQLQRLRAELNATQVKLKRERKRINEKQSDSGSKDTTSQESHQDRQFRKAS